jgi:hypothetical protein
MVSAHDQLVATDPLRELTAVPVGKLVSEKRFTWTNGILATVACYDGEELLYTLTFTWNPDGTLQKVVRS